MARTLRFLMAAGALTIAVPALALAQNAPASSAAASDEGPVTLGRPLTIQYVRPQDQRGINVFETSKEPGATFTGFRLDIGAGFAGEAQDLAHRNTAAPNVINGVDTNQLIAIGRGFNQPAANLY